MTAQEKLFEFFYILVQKRKVTAKEISEHFGVTARTVYRWCDSLSIAGIPIVTMQGKGGGISLIENYSFDSIGQASGYENSSGFSDDEKIALVSGLSALKNLSEGETSSYKNALDKIRNLAVSARDWVQIDFSPWNSVDQERKEIFQTSKNAIFESRQLGFDYFGNSSMMKKRTCHPWKLVFRGQSWYLLGYCNEKKEARYFKLSRIKNLVLLNERSTVMFSHEHERKLDSNYDELKNVKYYNVKARVDQKAVSYLLDSVNGVEIIESDNRYSIVRFKYPDAYWTVGFFLGFGSLIKVMAPKKLHDKIIREISRIV